MHIAVGGGVDTLDGGNGIDMAVYMGRVNDYRFTLGTSGEVRTVALKTAAGEMVDTLISVEVLQIGSNFYKFDDLSNLANGATYALADHVNAMTLADVQLVGVPGV